jgi:CHAD domain-containing protein
VRRKEAKRLDRRLRDALRALGAARDWDVFERDLDRPHCAGHARAQAEKARASARTAARSSAIRYLPGEALAWARGRPWRASARAGLPIEAFAREALERAYAKLLKSAAAVDWGDAPRRHRVRIRLKRLRYGCDCLRRPGRKRRKRAFMNRLRRLQGVLGDLNDIEVQRRLLKHLVEAERPARPVKSWHAGTRAPRATPARQLATVVEAPRRSQSYWRVPEAVPLTG